MAILAFNPSLNEDDIKVVSDYSKSLLKKAADDSNNRLIKITSTLRLPERQAVAMYDNIANGRIIQYKEPGQKVTTLCRTLLKAGYSRPYIVGEMTKMIEALSREGKRVSLHCVTPEIYSECNIIDTSKFIENPRDFAEELAKYNSVVKIITPFERSYKSEKIKYDANEPAIHVEIKQIV